MLADFSIDVPKRLTEKGATLSLIFGVCSPMNGQQNIHEIINIIKKLGVKHCCLIIDYGQIVNPSLVERYRVFCQIISENGISKEEIEQMTKENPSRLLSM